MVVSSDTRQKDRWDFRFPDVSRPPDTRELSTTGDEVRDFLEDGKQALRYQPMVVRVRRGDGSRVLEQVARKLERSRLMPDLGDLDRRRDWEMEQRDKYQILGSHYDQFADLASNGNERFSQALNDRANRYHFKSMVHEITGTICRDGITSLARRPGMSAERAERLVDYIGQREVLDAWYDRRLEKAGVRKGDLDKDWESLSTSPESYAVAIRGVRLAAAESLSDVIGPGRAAGLRRCVNEMKQDALLGREGRAFDKHCQEAGLPISHPVLRVIKQAQAHVPESARDDSLEH